MQGSTQAAAGLAKRPRPASDVPRRTGRRRRGHDAPHPELRCGVTVGQELAGRAGTPPDDRARHHPDDESITTGGTLARCAAEGVTTCLVTCTDGRYGPVNPDLGLVFPRMTWRPCGAPSCTRPPPRSASVKSGSLATTTQG